jgi:hypothetical protein
MQFTVGRKRHLGSDVTMATTAVVYCRAKRPKGIAGCLVPLNQVLIELSEIKVRTIKLSYIKLGSGTSNK